MHVWQLIAALFGAGAGALFVAERRGCFTRRYAASTLATEMAQVGAIVLPAYLGGIAPVIMATLLGILCTREWLTMLSRAWPRRRAACFIWAPLPALGFAAYAIVATRPHGFIWVVLIYGIVEVNDATAFLVGKAFGRRALAPRLSPAKTWEGLGAGAMASATFAWFVLTQMPDPPIAYGPLLCGLTFVAGIIGDLGTSFIKRQAGRKDFGALIPHQGGLLDLYDAFVAAAPLAALWRLGS